MIFFHKDLLTKVISVLLMIGPLDLNGPISYVVQLLQNIMKSTELQFPPEKKNLNPDCIDLCRKLLRRNPGNLILFS